MKPRWFNISAANEPVFLPTPEPVAELDRLGDEIGELSAHLEAATARLLDLIREFENLALLCRRHHRAQPAERR